MLTEAESQLSTFVAQNYALTGELLTAAAAFKDFGIPVGMFQKALDNTEFVEALKERGIIFERFNDDWTALSLTPIQLLVANCLLDLTDTRSQKKKLQDLDTSTATYQSWLKDPVFKDYIHRRAEQLIGENQHEVDTALLDRIRAGDLKAIAYYNEYTGRYVPVSKTQTANIDIAAIIVKVIEIIDEHVTDKNDKLRVGEELKKLISMRNMASAIVGEHDQIVIPAIVKMSALTELGDSNDA